MKGNETGHGSRQPWTVFNLLIWLSCLPLRCAHQCINHSSERGTLCCFLRIFAMLYRVGRKRKYRSEYSKGKLHELTWFISWTNSCFLLRKISSILIPRGLSFLDTNLCKYPSSALSLRPQRERNVERIQAAVSARGFGPKIAFVLFSQSFHLSGAQRSHLQKSLCKTCLGVHKTLKISNLGTCP